MPITAVDSITLALEHTKQQLFKPFRIAQWTKLAFVGLLAGELGTNGCNRSNFRFPGHPGGAPPFPSSLGIDHALLAALIATSIWMILMINHPFAGDVHVSTAAFEHAIHVIESLPR